MKDCGRQKLKLITAAWDFSCGPVVKNPPSTRDVGLIPGWGTRISHAMGQISSRATTREKPMRCNERSRMPQVSQLRPDTAKNK